MGSMRNTENALSLTVIYEISRLLTASQSLQTTLRDVLRLLASYLSMRAGVIALKEDGGGFRILASVHAPPPVMSERSRLAQEIAESIVRSAMPFVAPVPGEDPTIAALIERGAWPDHGDNACFIGVPIKTHGEPFGVLAVHRPWSEQPAFTFNNDVRLLVMVSNLVAQAIRLHQSLETADPALDTADPAPIRRPPRGKPVRVPPLEGFIGNSRAIQEVFAQIEKVAPTRTSVLLRGESGTGKELVARAIHTASPRKAKAFVSVNCAALPESLLESELFGHEKGAFTGATQERKGRFELADGGTLFLDEIGEISKTFQAKLLRVLQEGEFERVGGSRTVRTSFRLIAATNRNLEEAVAQGAFRGDLYYRLNVIPIYLPALRERREDIPVLADHFLARFNQENGRSMRFSAAAKAKLARCSFPGNVRELENFVHRVATLAPDTVIEDVDLACETGGCLADAMGNLCDQPDRRTVVPLADVTDFTMAAGEPAGLDDGAEFGDGEDDRHRLVAAMEKAGWVQAKAARLLGLTPRQIGYALRKHGIEIKRL